jgi:hypothetical protein
MTALTEDQHSQGNPTRCPRLCQVGVSDPQGVWHGEELSDLAYIF